MPPKELTKVLFKGAKETVVQRLEDYSARATKLLEEFAERREEAVSSIERDVRQVEAFVLQQVKTFFEEYQEMLCLNFEQRNKQVVEELKDSIKCFNSEVKKIMKSDLSDSKAIVVGLNGAFNDPVFFEKSCQEYIEGYYLLEKAVKENHLLTYHQQLVDRIEPWESSRRLMLETACNYDSFTRYPKSGLMEEVKGIIEECVSRLHRNLYPRPYFTKSQFEFPLKNIVGPI